ncbi:hypothetical protein EJP617_04560 [Erwinia sp. Ejp617]|nr:hypothetical protein EJP617_04560 [Erwinia sp. Ejp617]
MGAAAGFTGFWDTTDYSLNLNVSGELAIALGLKADVSLRIVTKPIFDYLSSDEEKDAIQTKVSVESFDSVITTGCVNILIGN